MKITVVDHVYLEKEHVERLKSKGELKIYKEPPKTPDELKARIRSTDIVIVGWSHLTKDIINSAKKLKMISIWATSCHYADLDAANARGVTVTHVPAYATESVAEHTFALLLAAARRLTQADQHVRRGDFDWRPFAGTEIYGKTLGIIGTGSIGLRVAEIAKTFNMRILGYDKYSNLKKAEAIGLKYVPLETLLRESDFITVHVTLTPETERLLGKKEINSMKGGSAIVNTSQGKVIDEKALVDVLKSGRIAYAGLDVFDEEPPRQDNPLFKLDNVVLSPHIGFHTVEAKKRCTNICIENVMKFIDGKPQNTC